MKNKIQGSGKKCRSYRTLLQAGVAASLFMALLTVFSCNNNKTNSEDSVDSAQNVNEQKADASALGTNTQSDADFIVKAANGGMTEVAMGKLAKEKASSASVKDFAAKMVKDHSKINEDLKSLASGLNVTIPAEINKDAQDNLDKLKKSAAKDFDKDYMDMMVKAHNDDVDMFQKASQDISTPEIHTFITDNLPTLQGHQQMAKDIQATLK